MDYLLSYSGLRSIRLGRKEPEHGEDQKELEHKFFHSILPMHRGTLQSICFRGSPDGIWGITQAYLDEGVYLCKDLRYLHLIYYYFPSQDDGSEGGFISDMPLVREKHPSYLHLSHLLMLLLDQADLFSGISDNLPRLQILKLDHTVKLQDDDPAANFFYYFTYGPHYTLPNKAFARQITSHKSQFFAQRRPQFLLELTTGTLMCSPVDSVSSSGSHCYQFQFIEGFESEDSETDLDADPDSDASIRSGPL
ncbi:hypothetical protein MD484_g7353, partial [Candolleomyces efflorescens]